MSNLKSSIFRYLKIALLSGAVGVLINVSAYFLKGIVFGKAELIHFVYTVMGLSLISIILGMIALAKGRTIVGLSLISGVILSVIFWVVTLSALSSHGW